MTFLKIALAILVTVCAVVVVTVVYVLAQIPPKEKATDPAVVRAMTIYSPVWWLLVAAILAILWWLFRRWLL